MTAKRGRADIQRKKTSCRRCYCHPEWDCHPTNTILRSGGEAQSESTPDANLCTQEHVKDTHGEDLPFQRLRADLPPGALQQLPEPVDSHVAPSDSRGRGRGRPSIPILPQPAPPPGPGKAPPAPTHRRWKIIQSMRFPRANRHRRERYFLAADTASRKKGRTREWPASGRSWSSSRPRFGPNVSTLNGRAG